MRDISIDNLPLEILVMIFRRVRLNDLKSAMLVSKKWKDIIEDPNIWKHFNSKPVYPEQVGQLLNIPRLCLMNKLQMRTGGEKEMVTLQGVDGREGPKFSVYLIRRVEDEHIDEIQKSEITDLDISNSDLIKVTPDLLGDFLNNLKAVKLHSTVFTVEQMNNIFEKMSEFTNIEKVDLNLKSTEVTKMVEEEFISAGLNKVQTLIIPDITKQLVNMQIENFFQKMSDKTEVKHLDLTNGGISFVPVEVLGKAFNNLETLKLTSITLSADHAKSFFKQMKEFTALKTLVVDTKNTNIDSVDARIFSKGIVKVKKVTFNYTYLSSEQLELLFQKIPNKESVITDLDVSTNDVSKVPAELLGEASDRLTVFKVKDSKLTKEQATAIFTKLAKGSANLVELDIGENNLEDVDPELLSNAINNVKIVKMGRCSLTSKQVQGIFEQILLKTRTKYLAIENNNTGELSAETIANVDKKLQVLFQRTKKQKTLKQMCTSCGKGPFLRLRLHKCKSK